jgi:hypothetical protein
MAGLVVQFIEPAATSGFLGGLLVLLLAWGVAAWYFYGKTSVVAYYRVVEAQAQKAT